MTSIKKVIFAGGRGTCREPMAMALLQKEPLWEPIIIQARGLVVLFPEPLNQKADAVLASNGIRIENYASVQLESSDFADDTLILVMDQATEKQVLAMEGAKNVHVLTDITGDELEIMDPYGGDLKVYGLCYETMANTIKRLADVLNEQTFLL